MRISDWSSDVCSSDLIPLSRVAVPRRLRRSAAHHRRLAPAAPRHRSPYGGSAMKHLLALSLMLSVAAPVWAEPPADIGESVEALRKKRSEEHTSELQSLMRLSYAVFCLHKKHHHTR